MSGFARILCWFGSHDLRVIGYPEPGSKQVVHYGCARCKRQWGMNRREQCVLPWHMVAADEEDIWGYAPSPQTVQARLDPKNWKRS